MTLKFIKTLTVKNEMFFVGRNFTKSSAIIINFSNSIYMYVWIYKMFSKYKAIHCLFWQKCYEKNVKFRLQYFQTFQHLLKLFITHRCMAALRITFKMASMDKVHFKQKSYYWILLAKRGAIANIHRCL